jgi:hypothetical protein
MNPKEFTFIKETTNNYIFVIDTKSLNLYTYQYPSTTTTKYRKYTDLATMMMMMTGTENKEKINSMKFYENLNYYLFLSQ